MVSQVSLIMSEEFQDITLMVWSTTQNSFLINQYQIVWRLMQVSPVREMGLETV